MEMAMINDGFWSFDTEDAAKLKQAVVRGTTNPALAAT